MAVDVGIRYSITVNTKSSLIEDGDDDEAAAFSCCDDGFSGDGVGAGAGAALRSGGVVASEPSALGIRRAGAAAASCS